MIGIAIKMVMVNYWIYGELLYIMIIVIIMGIVIVIIIVVESVCSRMQVNNWIYDDNYYDNCDYSDGKSLYLRWLSWWE